MTIQMPEEYVDGQASVMFVQTQSMDQSIHAGLFPRRACCVGTNEDRDPLAHAMSRLRRTRRIA